MQGSPDSEHIGEIQAPQPVTINAGHQAAMAYGAQPVQPIMQQNVVYIQMPKFKHPVRIWSYVLIGVGLLIYLVSTVFALDNGTSALFELGYGTCCMFFNAAFVCEIVFYYNMMQHNQSYGQGTGWAVTNIVFAAILIVIGLFIALGMFLSVLGL
ncbi:MAG: hypothetical protein ACPH9F_04620 [Candidatus Poseidoniaceae archaeon]